MTYSLTPKDNMRNNHLLSLFTIIMVLPMICYSTINQAINIDAYLVDATFHELNAQGKLQNTLHVSRLYYDKKKKTSLIIKPQLTFTDKKGCQWLVKALRGQRQRTKDYLTLSKQVLIKAQSGLCEYPIQLTTSQLTIYPQKAYATTNQIVYINQQPHGSLQAKGLKADFKTGHILFIQASGQYSPT